MGKPPAAAPGAIPWRGKLPLRRRQLRSSWLCGPATPGVCTDAVRCSSVGRTIGGVDHLVKYRCEVIQGDVYFTYLLSPVEGRETWLEQSGLGRLTWLCRNRIN